MQSCMRHKSLKIEVFSQQYGPAIEAADGSALPMAHHEQFKAFRLRHKVVDMQSRQQNTQQHASQKYGDLCNRHPAEPADKIKIVLSLLSRLGSRWYSRSEVTKKQQGAAVAVLHGHRCTVPRHRPSLGCHHFRAALLIVLL